VEVDLKEWLELVKASGKDIIGTHWDKQQDTFSGQLVAGRTEIMDKITPHFDTWDEFAKFHGNDRFCVEKSIYRLIAKEIGLQNVEFLNIELGNRFDQVDREAWKDDMFSCNFVGGPFLQIDGLSNREYDVVYGNPIDGSNYLSVKQKVGMISRPSKKFFRDWTVTAFVNGEQKFQHKLDLSGKRVLISMGSKALGDTLAWMPYAEEFRKKHNCHVICSSWWNKILDYPEIEFVEPGSQVQNVYATYEVGCFDTQPDMNPYDWRTVPLQKVATDILGLEYVPVRAKLKGGVEKTGQIKPYICFSEFSTMQAKLWNYSGGWQETIDYLNSLGYDCISISREKSQLKNIVSHNNQPIEQTISDIAGCQFYIGLNHGPSWIAYSLGIPYIMIDGLAEEWNNPPNPYRISIDVGCKPCFNNTSIPINRSWDWCTNGDKFACTKAIVPEMVIEMIKKIREDDAQ